MSRPTMREIWMHTAINISKRSCCSKAQVGCVITTKDYRKVLGNGYNGGAANIDYVCKEESCSCLHAENNAVIDAQADIKDKVFFVTMFPCLSCSIQIINSGCSEVIYNKEYKQGSRHWNNYANIIDMFQKSNIKITQLEL